jgi:RNA-directed DNA polymerase
MEDTDFREQGPKALEEAVPGPSAPLAAAPNLPQPKAKYRFPECSQSLLVTKNCVILEESPHHRLQPFCRLRHPRQRWLRTAVERRLRGELAKLQVEVNEEKSRRVDLTQGESFGFLGFEFRRIRSRRGRWMPLRTPRSKKRTALLGTLKQVFRSHRSRPIAEVIARINPILRGWVQYFAVGHSSRCFSFIRDWVEKKIRHHLARASQRHGFGWKRWSRAWLYGELGLFHDYRVAY